MVKCHASIMITSWPWCGPAQNHLCSGCTSWDGDRALRAPHSCSLQLPSCASCSCPPSRGPCSWTRLPAPQPKGLTASLPPTRTCLPCGDAEISKPLPHRSSYFNCWEHGLMFEERPLWSHCWGGLFQDKSQSDNGREFARPGERHEFPK